jgi:hypothetical protein
LPSACSFIVDGLAFCCRCSHYMFRPTWPSSGVYVKVTLWVLRDSGHWQITLQITDLSSRKRGHPKTKNKAIVRQKKLKIKIWSWAPKGWPTPRRDRRSQHQLKPKLSSLSEHVPYILIRRIMVTTALVNFFCVANTKCCNLTLLKPLHFVLIFNSLTMITKEVGTDYFVSCWACKILMTRNFSKHFVLRMRNHTSFREKGFCMG